MGGAADTSRAHVEWARSANIYEVNIRQYTPQGSFAAFEPHLPRLRAMGVDILWLMPVQPPGVKQRKGTLGSPYAVRDYTALNPDFGTLAEFRRLVDTAHAHGMHVLIDWVANHTAWDHRWIDEHPDWYKKNGRGEITSYEYHNSHEIEYWTDVVGLDYSQPALWIAMTDALAWWVRETGIDGFRCDVAGLVPTAFWEQARDVLDRIKPVFLLAEWSEPELHRKAFDMTYDWSLHDAMRKIARGDGDVEDLMTYLEGPGQAFPADAYRMQFTSNHDKNAWEGSDTELWGASFGAFAVLAATLPGMPLIYGGQEAGLGKRLPLFEKDTIDWRATPQAPLYTQLLDLKHRNPALWNGRDGAPVEVLPCSSRHVFAFRRATEGSAVTVVLNLSDSARSVRLDPAAPERRLEAWSWWLDEQPGKPEETT